jgi:Cu/Ag efflux pump CusA
MSREAHWGSKSARASDHFSCTLAAGGLGLLPAAVSSGIGVQAQQPLARVVVDGMVTSPLAILLLIPVFASYWLPSTKSPEPDAPLTQ